MCACIYVRTFVDVYAYIFKMSITQADNSQSHFSLPHSFLRVTSSEYSSNKKSSSSNLERVKPCGVSACI